ARLLRGGARRRDRRRSAAAGSFWAPVVRPFGGHCGQSGPGGASSPDVARGAEAAAPLVAAGVWGDRGRLAARARRPSLGGAAGWWPPVRAAYRWVRQVARLLKNREQRPVADMRRRLSRLLSAMRQAAARTEAEELRPQLRHFLKVTKSWRPGLFHCYQVVD